MRFETHYNNIVYLSLINKVKINTPKATQLISSSSNLMSVGCLANFTPPLYVLINTKYSLFVLSYQSDPNCFSLPLK